MILEPRHITLIEAGRKTRITRPKNKWSSPPKVGQSYPIQKRVMDKKRPWSEWDQEKVQRLRTECRVKVTAVFEGLAHEIDDRQAKAEGHDNREAYLDWFEEVYGPRPEIIHNGEPLPIPVEVIVACVQVVGRERYMATGSFNLNRITCDEHGYVGSASRAIDHLAAVDEDFQQRISAGEFKSPGQRAYERERQEQLDNLNDRPLEEQLAEVRRMAKEKGIDLSRQERELKGRIGAMRRKVERRAA